MRDELRYLIPPFTDIVHRCEVNMNRSYRLAECWGALQLPIPCLCPRCTNPRQTRVHHPVVWGLRRYEETEEGVLWRELRVCRVVTHFLTTLVALLSSLSVAAVPERNPIAARPVRGPARILPQKETRRVHHSALFATHFSEWVAGLLPWAGLRRPGCFWPLGLLLALCVVHYCRRFTNEARTRAPPRSLWLGPV